VQSTMSLYKLLPALRSQYPIYLHSPNSEHSPSRSASQFSDQPKCHSIQNVTECLQPRSKPQPDSYICTTFMYNNTYKYTVNSILQYNEGTSMERKSKRVISGFLYEAEYALLYDITDRIVGFRYQRYRFLQSVKFLGELT
jgi:hypothetical protein